MSLLAALAPTRAVVDGVSRLCLLLILWIFSQYAHAEYSYHLYYDQNYYATPVEACASNATLLVANFNKCPYGGCTPVREVSNYVIEPPVPYGDSIVYYCSITIEFQSNPPELRTYTHSWMSRVGAPDLCEDGQPVDPITGKCPEPPKCQISLSGFPAEVEPGKEVKNLRADVYCDGVLTAKGVVLTATVDKTSGGHEGTHNPDRPVGSLSPSSGNSSLPFSFGAPAPAGTHTVTAKCTDDSCGAAEGNVKVWVSLQPLLTDPNYVLIKPNADQNHPSNHHVTGTTQQKISGLAADYHKRFPIDPLLHLNDASLVWGGLFDLAANWSGQPYGHSTHRKGTDIDVQAHEFYHDPKKSIPSYNYVDFMRIASKHGCNAQIHSGATQNEHFHLYCADR